MERYFFVTLAKLGHKFRGLASELLSFCF